MNNKKCLISSASGAAMLAALASTPAVYADDDVQFAGFASFVYAKTISDREEGDLDSISAEGSERDFNKFGLRMDKDLQDGLSFTSQLIAKGSDDYDPEIDWMFATIELNPSLSLGIGKMRLPLFQYSDFLDVGYAYQWIEPPAAVYSGGFDALDGMKLSYLSDLGDWSSEVQVWLGNIEEDVLQIDDSYGVAWQVDGEWISLRAVYGFGRVTSASGNTDVGLTGIEEGIASLETAVNTAPPNGLGGSLDLSGVMDDLKLEGDDGTFIGIAAFMDFDGYFMGIEATQTTVDDTVVFGDTKSYYIMAGMRLPQSWTLTFTYSKDDDEYKQESIDDAAAALAAYNAATTPYVGAVASIDSAITALQTGLATVGGAVKAIQQGEAETYTLGARWDFHSNASFKIEYLTKDSDTVREGKREPQALRLGLDLVF